MRRALTQLMAPAPHLFDELHHGPGQLIWVHDLDPISRWHRGNVVLARDAAHASRPTSGQGASQALVDAVVAVSECLTILRTVAER